MTLTILLDAIVKNVTKFCNLGIIRRMDFMMMEMAIRVVCVNQSLNGHVKLSSM